MHVIKNVVVFMKLTLLSFLILFLSINADEKPNFVFIIADDISTEDIGAYGHPVIQTPHIDKLAETGMRFNNAYLTISSCSPSRCSIISGRYPHNTGAPELHTSLPKDQVKFPKILRENGYYTVLSGKNHIAKFTETFDKVSNGKGPGKNEDWVSILEKRPKDKPFFMWFAASDAHAPFTINDKAKVYDPKDIIIPPYMVDGPKIRKELAGYYHEVTRFDFYIGEVIKELKKQNIFDNTMIIVMADNGRPFTRAKTRLYDSGIKTPFIVHFPKVISEGSVSSSLLSSIDVSATILELAGIAKDERIQGVSFLPIMKDPKATVREVVFSEHNWHVNQAHERMVRFGDYLYIKNNFPDRKLWCVEASYPELDKAYKEGKLNQHQLNVFRNPCPEEELYHIGSDPEQLTNLAGKEETSEIIAKARKLLENWTSQTGDTVPKDPTPDRGTKGTKGRNPHKEFPGKTTGADKINHLGPIKLD